MLFSDIISTIKNQEAVFRDLKNITGTSGYAQKERIRIIKELNDRYKSLRMRNYVYPNCLPKEHKKGWFSNLFN